MKRLRRESVVAWGRRLLAAGVFVLLGYLFANNLRPWPRYEVRTGTKVEEQMTFRGWGFTAPLRTTVEYLSDDSHHVIVGTYEGDDCRLNEWDLKTGADLTPGHWRQPEWRRMVNGRGAYGFSKLLDNPTGREFLADGEAWARLRQRLVANGIWDSVRSGRNRWHRDDFRPDGIAFSSDGLYLTHRSPNEPQASVLLWFMAGGQVVEESRTGRRVATFPAGVDRLLLAPGGRAAISGNIPAGQQKIDVLPIWQDEDPKCPPDRPFITLWNLESQSPRAELMLPGWPLHVEFSPDGRYVLARVRASNLSRWWEADTGKPVADIYTSTGPEFLDGGRQLVVRSPDNETLYFWDVATGRELDKWDLDPPPNGRITELICSADRFVLAGVEPNAEPSGQSFGAWERVVDWMSDRLPDKRSARERQQILVLDAIDRRALGQVRGVAGSVSANGRWLATLDADGVVRVWELPVGRPWARGFAYAAGVFVGAWGVGRLWRRRRRASSVASATRL